MSSATSLLMPVLVPVPSDSAKSAASRAPSVPQSAEAGVETDDPFTEVLEGILAALRGDTAPDQPVPTELADAEDKTESAEDMAVQIDPDASLAEGEDDTELDLRLHDLSAFDLDAAIRDLGVELSAEEIDVAEEEILAAAAALLGDQPTDGQIRELGIVTTSPTEVLPQEQPSETAPSATAIANALPIETATTDPDMRLSGNVGAPTGGDGHAALGQTRVNAAAEMRAQGAAAAGANESTPRQGFVEGGGESPRSNGGTGGVSPLNGQAGGQMSSQMGGQSGGHLPGDAPFNREVFSFVPSLTQGVERPGNAPNFAAHLRAGGTGNPAGNQPTTDQVAFHIRTAAADGIERMTVHLRPAHLGSVEIQLDRAEDGMVRAHVIVDKPETLDQLQRDSKSLDRALQNAGLSTDQDSLNFSLRQQQAQEQDGQQRNSDAEGDNDGDEFAPIDEDSAGDELHYQGAVRLNDGLDIRV